MARSKKLKALNYDGEDIISNLPDDILSHILSFLPTREAARTSLLSKRWRYSWTCITGLEFDDESQYKRDAPETEKQKFLGIVNRILLQQISTSSIHSFTLCFSNSEIQYPSEDLNALIHRVLEQKVQKLSIKQINDDRCLHNVLFPCAVFNSRSLIELDISVRISLRFPSPNCLANLRVLKFGHIKFFGDCFSSSKELMLSFPVLKVFEIVYCKFFDVNGLVIDTPMLESLVIRDTKFKGRLENERSSVSGAIKFFALGLRKFFYHGNLEGGIILSNPLTVVDVFLNVWMPRIEDKQKTCVKACRLLKEFHKSVKFLELGPYMIQTLAMLKDDSLLRLPIFKSLVSLVLANPWTFSLFDLLLKLLQKSPNLQRLELHPTKFGTSLPSSKDVPHCIQCNLKVVKLAIHQWDEDKFQFTKYVLENARALDRLTVIILKGGVRNVIKELRSFPKASSSAQIKGKRMTSKEGNEHNDKYQYPLFLD